MPVQTSHRVTPQKAHKAIGGKKKRGRSTLGFGEQLPVWVSGGVIDPLTKFDNARGIGLVHIISCDRHSDDCNNDNRNDENAFGHKAGLYCWRLSKLTQGYTALAFSG